MLKRVLKLVALTFLGLVLLLAGWTGYRLVVAPEETKFAIAALYISAKANHSPPLIAASGVLEDGPNWMATEPTSGRFTAILRKTFPLGSNVTQMRTTLIDQGFVPDTEEDCRDRTAEEIRRNQPAHCTSREIPDALRYDWGGLPCNQELRVFLTADRLGHLTNVVGRYGAACL